jgi:GNAT superfamily N-acetyltransferase
MQSAVRRATRDDLAGIVDVLTAAFHDDPLMSWVFPGRALRLARLRGLWGFMAGEAYLPFGASTVVPSDPGADAAALWLAPGQELGRAFWDACGHAFAAALEYDVDRLSSLGDLMQDHHPRDPHWYLLAIGVSPARQGGRLGSALLADTLARADETGTGAYLEATSLRSRALYERVGFVATGEFAPPGGPPVWPMWREPT